MTDEIELTPENAGQLLFGRPARAPAEGEPTDVAETRAEASLQPEPEPEPAGAAADHEAEFIDALRGRSQASKREAARALVASIHGTEEPDEGEPTDAGARQALAGYANKHRDLIASIHPGVERTDGTASTGFDGGARGESLQMPGDPRPQPVAFSQPGDPWGDSYEFDAAAIFPSLADER